MSEYYLKYYELNKSKNQLIRTGKKIGNLGTRYSRIRLDLTGQRGLGIDKVRDQLEQLSRSSRRVNDNIHDIGTFLETLLRETEAADHEARKILNRFSLDSVRQFLKVLQKLLQNLNKLILAWAGGEAKASGNTGVEWLSKVMGLGNDEVTQTSWEGAAGKLFSWISKQLVKGMKGKSGNAGAVKGGFDTNGFYASWVAGVVGDSFENFTDGQGTIGEDVEESIFEGLLEGGKALGITAITGAIVGAIGLSGGAAAAVGVGVAIVVGWGLDIVSEQIFQNDLGMIENVGDVLCNWWDQLAIW